VVDTVRLEVQSVNDLLGDMTRVIGYDMARAQVHRQLRRSMKWIPAEYVDAMTPTTGWAGGEDELLAMLRKFEAIGTDEIELILTRSELNQLRRVADVVAEF